MRSQSFSAVASSWRDAGKPSQIPIEASVFNQCERDKVLGLGLSQEGSQPVADEFALGNILVASGDITPAQLEDGLRQQVTSGRRLGEELIKAGHLSKGQVDSGLVLQRNLLAYALAASVGLASVPSLVSSAEAAQKNAALSVTVTVIANAKVRTEYQAAQLTISAADVARGYTEIAAASRFAVLTNSRSGYLMEFNPVGNLFAAVEVAGLGKDVHLGADGGSVAQRGPTSPGMTHELSFRFTLRPEARPGDYPWPLQLSVRPLY